MFLKPFRGNDLYGIRNYDNLAPLLGKRRHIRGINSRLDFCAVKKETVIFHLYRKSPVKDFIAEDNFELIHAGSYMLVFKFVRFDGVHRQLQDFV